MKGGTSNPQERPCQGRRVPSGGKGGLLKERFLSKLAFPPVPLHIFPLVKGAKADWIAASAQQIGYPETIASAAAAHAASSGVARQASFARISCTTKPCLDARF